MSRARTGEDLKLTFKTLREILNIKKLFNEGPEWTKKDLGFVSFVLAVVGGVVWFAESRQNDTNGKIQKLAEDVDAIKKVLQGRTDNAGGSTSGASASAKDPQVAGVVKELQGEFENAEVAAAKNSGSV